MQSNTHWNVFFFHLLCKYIVSFLHFDAQSVRGFKSRSEALLLEESDQDQRGFWGPSRRGEQE